jgi:hypothetical protein
MLADAGSIGGSRDEEALVTADAPNRTETKDTEEPIPGRAVGVVEGFGVTGGADFFRSKTKVTSSAVMCPKFRFGVSYFEGVCIICF